MNIYIATPISARKEKTFRDKWNAAAARCRALQDIIKDDPRFAGAAFTSTFHVNSPAVRRATEAIAMGNCIRAVLDADAIYLDHGWNNSKGCCLEYQAAKIYGKDIYEHDSL